MLLLARYSLREFSIVYTRPTFPSPSPTSRPSAELRASIFPKPSHLPATYTRRYSAILVPFSAHRDSDPIGFDRKIHVEKKKKVSSVGQPNGNDHRSIAMAISIFIATASCYVNGGYRFFDGLAYAIADSAGPLKLCSRRVSLSLEKKDFSLRREFAFACLCSSVRETRGAARTPARVYFPDEKMLAASRLAHVGGAKVRARVNLVEGTRGVAEIRRG